MRSAWFCDCRKPGFAEEAWASGRAKGRLRPEGPGLIRQPSARVSGLSPGSLRNNAKQTNKSQIKEGKIRSGTTERSIYSQPVSQSAHGPVGAPPGLHTQGLLLTAGLSSTCTVGQHL